MNLFLILLLYPSFLAAFSGTTLMISQFSGKSHEGEAVCKSVGLNYGLWTKPETIEAVVNYLKDKGDLWFGAEKNPNVIRGFITDCTRIESSDAHTYLRWESEPTTHLPAFIFNPPNVADLNHCNENKITVKEFYGKLKFEDTSSTDKQFLCVKEEGELLLDTCTHVIFLFRSSFLLCFLSRSHSTDVRPLNSIITLA